MAPTVLLFHLSLVLTVCEVTVSAAPSDDDDPGFEDIFQTNNKTYENFPIQFQHPLPTWLRGILVRNGPGQLEMGRRKYQSYFDGYAKLHSWTFPGNGSAFFSAKMIKSKSYLTSIEKCDIEPYMTLGVVSPSYTFMEKMQCIRNNVDDMNVNVFNYINRTVAISDLWFAYEFDLHTLDTIRPLIPPMPSSKNFYSVKGATMSSAHPVPEYGTSSRIEFMTIPSFYPGTKHRMAVVRITTLDSTEMVAEWETDQLHYMHSFSVTPNYVILFAAPYTISIMKMMQTCSVEGGMVWDGNANTTIYVVEIKTGRVHTLQTETVFVIHHINAFETPDGKIVMDLPTQINPFAFDYFDFSYLFNKTARMDILSTPVLKRYTIDLRTKTVSKTVFENGPKAPCAGALEMPVINENYRHIKYCYIYGQVINYNGKGFSHFALVKKDVCNNKGDLMYAVPHHYFTEPWFIPTPGGNSEDDGVLMTSAYDGDAKQSYLAIIDPKTMTLRSRANLPTTVPFNFHGRFFDIN
ncbi:beta,beta-carotene 15,15'-dioxygenase-like [Ylistrum balloti]|uniref:beta,beta-carotene 15,15'-dioxygenase-like n=1 Tax=Ylistrum balloti TaxID=509963 RepID=UPI002905B6B7|nr:beta,beta-carotene 15,15'-dioxygenase-like [Ylistrum balloti]XP_060066168.1 beta,beta-carotene 15,15'-dioxygenase-like [Ylistrum balloti]